jgi:hypothetical protein
VSIKTVKDPLVRQRLIARLNALEPERQRRWGSLTAHEMLCHLGDAAAMVLGERPRATPPQVRNRTIVKWVFLWSAIRWPHGQPTNPQHNPRLAGTRPSEFARDLARAIDGIERIGAGRAIEPVHGLFGTMTSADWQRWAYRHTDHHLRQFGL